MPGYLHQLLMLMTNPPTAVLICASHSSVTGYKKSFHRYFVKEGTILYKKKYYFEILKL